MVNQWGRDGGFGSGNAGSRSAAGVIIPAVLALIIGAGGGYAGARFLSGVSESDIVERDKRIAALNKTLSDMKFDGQGAAGQQAALQQRVKDLQAARDDAAAEIAALKKTIEAAGDLSGQLASARKSIKAYELKIAELERTVGDQKARIGKLQAAAEQQADASTSPAIVLRQGQKTMLEAQLDQARKAAADTPDLKSRIAALEDEVAKASDEAEQKAAQVAALQKQKDELQARLDAASKSADASGQQAGKIAALQKQLDNMAESLTAAKAELDQSRNRIKTLTGQNETLASDRDALQQQVASLKDTIAQLKTATPPANDRAPASNDANAGQADAAAPPRNSGDVQKAVADLPGFDSLAADKQAVLVDMLEKGACVTDALKAAYGYVSPISLRSLFRDLGGSC